MITGGVVSMLIPVTLTPAGFPAMSVAVPMTFWLAPCTSTDGPVQFATPDAGPAFGGAGAGSLQTNETVTGALYQPLPLGARSGDPTIIGGVRSMLIPLTVACAELLATSFAVPVALWFVVSALNTTGWVQPAAPA